MHAYNPILYIMREAVEVETAAVAWSQRQNTPALEKHRRHKHKPLCMAFFWNACVCL